MKLLLKIFLFQLFLLLIFTLKLRNKDKPKYDNFNLFENGQKRENIFKKNTNTVRFEQTSNDISQKVLNTDNLKTISTEAMELKLDGVYIGNRKIQIDPKVNLKIKDFEINFQDMVSLFNFNKKLVEKCGNTLEMCIFNFDADEVKSAEVSS